MMYTDGSSGIAVLSAEEDNMFAILETIHTQGKGTLTEDTLDLSAYAGQKIMIDVVDAFEGGWGWLAIDEIQITNTSKEAALVVQLQAGELTGGYDAAQVDHLEGLGYNVRVVDQTEIGDTFTVGDANEYDLVVISESCGSGNTVPLYTTSAPVMHEEAYGWPEASRWNLAGPREGQNVRWVGGDAIEIVNDTHPIVVAAGIGLGTMPFFNISGSAWTTQSVDSILPDAELIAQVSDGGENFMVIFALEAGSARADGSITDSRIVALSLPGHFPEEGTYAPGPFAADDMTDEAWALYDAAIAWLDPPPPEMVAYYPLDEGSGVAVADASGNGRDGIILGDPNNCWVEGVLGTALQFGTAGCDGVDCNMWDPSADTNELSVSCWVSYLSGGSSWQGIVANRTGWDVEAQKWAFELNGSSGECHFGSRGGGSAYGLGTLPEGEWIHLAFTFDGATIIVYHDGEEVASGGAGFGPDNNSTVRIGASEASGNIFEGTIDDVRIFDAVLTKDEIAAIY
jgi:hypothetical protein